MHEYLEFLRYCIDESLPLPENAKNIDWKRMMEWSEKQAVVGICFSGIERLKNSNIKVSFPVLMEWIGYANRIEQQNRLVNKRCIEVVREFKIKGFECCVLKGQGNALMYSNPLSRCPGDIDLLVKGNKKDIINYVKQRFPHTKTAYQHIDYPVFKDVEVELHYLPTYLNNPIYNHRFQKWYNKMADRGGLKEEVELPEGIGSIPVPTIEFNIVFQLAHMMHHFFDEGIGLRQFVDYYYLLKSVHGERLMVLSDVGETLKHLNLYCFAGAVMYIMKEVLGLEDKYLILPVDERRGKTLLQEILKGGNFGHYSGLDQKNALTKYFQKTWRNMQLVKEYPAEALCEPVFRTWHFFWRLRH